MGLLDRIKNLASNQNITIAELERRIGLSNGQIRKWQNQTPGIDKVQLVADYFNVSTDYLLGRTDNPNVDTDNVEDEFATFFRINTEGMSEQDKEKLQEELKEYFEFMKNRLTNK